MESPDLCDKCPGYSICANHIKKNDHSCKPFLRELEEKILQSAAEAHKLPLFSKYKKELESSLRKDDDQLLKNWYLAGACKMFSILKRGDTNK